MRPAVEHLHDSQAASGRRTSDEQPSDMRLTRCVLDVWFASTLGCCFALALALHSAPPMYVF